MFQQQAESEGVQPNHNNNMPNSISEEPINQLPSNSGGSANQSDQCYVMEPDEEENEAASEGATKPNVSPSSQSNSSSGGSADQSDQFFDPEMSAEHLNYYRPLYLAARSGDWATAKSFIELDPDALTATITAITKQTVLHVAAFYWKWEFVLKLLELTSPESIAVQTQYGQTVLHYAAQVGSLKAAKALVQKNSDLLQMVNNQGDLPLFFSIWSGNKELVWYLSLKTRYDSPTFPFFPQLPRILHNLILAGYLGKN